MESRSDRGDPPPAPEPGLALVKLNQFNTHCLRRLYRAGHGSRGPIRARLTASGGRRPYFIGVAIRGAVDRSSGMTGKVNEMCDLGADLAPRRVDAPCGHARPVARIERAIDTMNGDLEPLLFHPSRRSGCRRGAAVAPGSGRSGRSGSGGVESAVAVIRMPAPQSSIGHLFVAAVGAARGSDLLWPPVRTMV